MSGCQLLSGVRENDRLIWVSSANNFTNYAYYYIIFLMSIYLLSISLFLFFNSFLNNLEVLHFETLFNN